MYIDYLQGIKMHANIYSECVQQFRSMVAENCIYTISMFHIVPNLDDGNYEFWFS